MFLVYNLNIITYRHDSFLFNYHATIINQLFNVSVSAMLPLLFKQEYLALSSKKDESRNSFSPYSRSLQGTFA